MVSISGLTPHDGVANKAILSVHLVVTVLCSLMATLGVIFAVVCLIFNFIYRNSKYENRILMSKYTEFHNYKQIIVL